MPKLSTMIRSRTVNALAAALMVGTALTATVLYMPVGEVQAQQTAQAIDPSRGFADLVDRVMPAVVSVQVKFANVADSLDQSSNPDQSMPEQFREFFEQSPQFRQGRPPEGRQRPDGMAQGSGFIISADGYAVTNNHVVQNASEVSIKMRDGVEHTAQVLGTDPKTDLALLKIKADKPFSFVQFSKTAPRVGDWVMAVGNPFGLGGSVTTGIISAQSRDIGSGPYDDFLQIDASINRGNSGGPAFNLEGEVIGINTAIFSPTGGSVGIGFAIPASTAEDVIASLKENGAVTRGWLGVQIQPVTAEIAESLGLTAGKGAIVSDVTEGSPALAAGLKAGDTILKVGGKDIADARDLARRVAQIKPGAAVSVAIVRDGKPMDVTVKIGVMPGDPKMAGAETQQGNSLAKLGITIAPAEDGAGVVVKQVDPSGAAAQRGLKAGDVILEVAGQEVNSPADISNALKSSSKKRVLLLVRSGDTQRFLALPVDQG